MVQEVDTARALARAALVASANGRAVRDQNVGVVGYLLPHLPVSIRGKECDKRWCSVFGYTLVNSGGGGCFANRTVAATWAE